jgi:hypothetical protein
MNSHGRSYICIVGDVVQSGPLGTAATNRPIVLAPGDYGGVEIGGMIGRENWSTRRKLAPVPLCPPQTPHAARTQTRGTVPRPVGFLDRIVNTYYITKYESPSILHYLLKMFLIL